VQVVVSAYLGHNGDFIVVGLIDFRNFAAYFVDVLHVDILSLKDICKLDERVVFMLYTLIFIAVLFAYKILNIKDFKLLFFTFFNEGTNVLNISFSF